MKCFYHNDLDGKGGASLVLKHGHNKYANEVSQNDFIELDYKKPFPIHVISKNELVYIIDYSFKESTKFELDAVLARTKNVVWLDHHISSIRLLDKFPEYYDTKATIVLDTGRSGAKLAYNYFYPNERNVPTYIKYIDDWDRFINKHKESSFFKLYMDSIDHGPFSCIWEDLLYNEADYKEILYRGEIIHSYVNNLNTEDPKGLLYETEIDGHKCIAINRFLSGRNSGLLGSKFKDYPLGIVWTFDGKEYVYSIYSTNKNIDCSKIAEKFGGGGHPGAAGFISKELLFKRECN